MGLSPKRRNPLKKALLIKLLIPENKYISTINKDPDGLDMITNSKN